MVRAGHLEWIAEDSCCVIIIITGGIAIAPGRQGFPTERHNDLFAPFTSVFEPCFIFSPPVPIKTELPWTVEIQPIRPFDGSPLAIGPRVFRPRVSKSVRHMLSLLL